MEELEQQAKTLGRDAIIGVQFEWEAIVRTGYKLCWFALVELPIKLDKKNIKTTSEILLNIVKNFLIKNVIIINNFLFK